MNGRAKEKNMAAYYDDGRGRYGTGESYDWFQKYEDGVDTYTSDDGLWTYTYIGDDIEILRYNGNDTNIVVPNMIAGKKVVSLDSTFDGFYELESAVIPEGVTSIVGVFYGCEGLEEVTLPDSIVDMTYAFNCCYSLEDIDIPSGVKNLSFAFGGTTITQIKFPDGAEDLAEAFAGSEDLEYAFIPKSVKKLTEAFSDCEALAKVDIEVGLTSIGDYAFYNCPKLLELTIPESVVEFGEYSVGYIELKESVVQEKIAYKMKGVQILPGFKIRGIAGSAAEKYARENGIEFVVI